MPIIVLLSGPISSGKTSLADQLIQRHGFQRLKSSDHLKAMCVSNGVEISRASLQKTGDDLDAETDFHWLVTDVAAPQMALNPSQQKWLIDAVRKPRQVEHFRADFHNEVLHVHLWAPEEVLKERYDRRRASGADNEGATSYAEAVTHPNEKASRALQGSADIAINVTTISAASAADAISLLVS